jgi:hypothetical protein
MKKLSTCSSHLAYEKTLVSRNSSRGSGFRLGIGLPLPPLPVVVYHAPVYAPACPAPVVIVSPACVPRPIYPRPVFYGYYNHRYSYGWQHGRLDGRFYDRDDHRGHDRGYGDRR